MQSNSSILTSTGCILYWLGASFTPGKAPNCTKLLAQIQGVLCQVFRTKRVQSIPATLILSPFGPKSSTLPPLLCCLVGAYLLHLASGLVSALVRQCKASRLQLTSQMCFGAHLPHPRPAQWLLCQQ